MGIPPIAPGVPRLRKSLRGKAPTLNHERALWRAGHDVVVGMDEVGRGSWAGPVSVGAAIIPRNRRVYKVRDSKLLTEREREALFDRLSAWCVAWAVGHAGPEECDRLGMSAALRLAAQRALQSLDTGWDRVLLDGNWDFATDGRAAELLVNGDALSVSIATASILAKVSRDRIMRATAAEFPGYGFESNKGYPGPVHQAALQAWGPTTIHRRSWVFMDRLPWSGVRRYRRPDAPGARLDFD